jgi:methionyl-tRNA formyltransferase
MRVILAGQKSFGAAVYDMLREEGHDVAGVVTPPGDKLHRAVAGKGKFAHRLSPLTVQGRDAVRWTIHLGDAIAGGSVYWFTDSVDCGPIAAQDWCFVPPAWRTSAHPVDGASILWRQELFPMGIRLLRDVLRDLDNGVIVEIPQDELNATWEPSWERSPLHRPELPQIGSMNGYRHVTAREKL